MAKISKRYQDEHSRIKKDIEYAYDWFVHNYKSFNEYRTLAFKTTLTQNEKGVLNDQQKPIIEFNTLEAYISRLRGEYSKQMPSVVVTSSDDTQPVAGGTLKLVEDHARAALFDANRSNAQYNVYTDCISGGFSAYKIWTEYEREKSFNQVIKFDRVYDPTLVGFDPLAKDPHKGDGRYCYEYYPRTKESFEKEYPDIDLDDMKFPQASESQFQWSFGKNDQDILLVCDFYEKKENRKKLVELAPMMGEQQGRVMFKDEYEDFLREWENSGSIEQPPVIVNERWTKTKIICRYRLIGTQVIEYVETNFRYLPLVFVDGNSVLLRDADGGAVKQYCRPYFYNAIGAQKLKNYAGQCLANELENMIQHKLIIAQESIPTAEQYRQALFNYQQPNMIIYNHFYKNDTDKTLPPPREVARTPIPPEITNTFNGADSLMQNILGSYDASLGINDNQLSGVAIVEAATQSNAAAMPYIVGQLTALTQLATIYVDLLPKYITSQRTIPVMNAEGQRAMQMINNKGGPAFKYGEDALNVKVEAGVNFNIQKSRALQQIIALMQASQMFSQFMNTKGLPVLLDNMEFRGSDTLRQQAEIFMKQLEQQQQQAAQQPNPAMIDLQLKQAQLQQKAEQDKAQNELRSEELTTNRIKVFSEMQRNEVHDAVQSQKANVEMQTHLLDAAVKTEDQMHRHAMEKIDMHHQHLKDAAELHHNHKVTTSEAKVTTDNH